MSILINKVEISNIQIHEHFVFEPYAAGITAIRGVNGSGKSTIVDSIAWGLYGTKPNGVSKTISLYREGATMPEDKCFVKIDLNVDGRHILVERKIVDKKGKVECNVSEEKIDNDGNSIIEHIAGPSVSHTAPEIRKILQMDEKGFLTAILVQQKKVDEIIVASASSRAQIIEKLTGISSITTARDKAREQVRDWKKELKDNSFDDKELSKNIDAKEKIVKDLSKLEESLEKSQAHLAQLETDKSAFYKEYMAADTAIQENDANKEKMTILQTRIDSAEENLASAIEEKDEKKSQLSQLSVGSDIQEVSQQLKTIQAESRRLQMSKGSVSNRIDELTQRIERINAYILKSKVETLEDAQSLLQQSEEKLKDRKDNLSEKQNIVVSLNSEAKKIDKAIKILSEEDGHCPTCLQKVESVSVAVDSLNAQKQELLTKADEAEAEITTLKENISVGDTVVAKQKKIVEAFETLSEDQQSLKEKNSELEEVNASITVNEAELSATEKVFNEVKKSADIREAYQKALSKAQSISQTIEQLRGQFNRVSEEVKKAGVITPTALKRLQKKYDDSLTAYNTYSLKVSELSGDTRVLREQLKNVERIIDEQETIAKSYKSTLESLEMSQNTLKVIEEFREDRINHSIPIIETYASDLLSRFTDGKFSALKMDSSFNARIVLSNGSERAVGSLSGGELSLASISLLVSVSMLLQGGGTGNPIILDEVFVSQDANRAELSISTIKEVCQGQVIMIAHNESLDGVADKVVEL